MIKVSYKNIDTTNNKNSILIESIDKIISSVNAEEKKFNIFSIKSSLAQISEFSTIAERIKNNYSDIVVIAMGGSVLNPQSLITLCANRKNGLNIHFLHNTDPIYFKQLFRGLDLNKTAILATSNSGQTLETNALVGAVVNLYKENSITNFGSSFFFITKEDEGTLANVAHEIKGTIIPHAQNISGRYSGLTNVSTFVSCLAGVNIEKYIEGANLAISDFIQLKEESISAKSVSAVTNSGKNILVNIGYLQNFEPFLEWYSQIIAESLGKAGKGYTPVRGLGPNDQHSMLQLYLEGPQDKFYSMFYVKDISCDSRIDGLDSIAAISSKSLEYINKANFEATCGALEEQILPIREIILDNLSEKTIGYLTANLMLEVILIGYTMNIDPFNQPGVELIKKRSTKLISS